VGGAMWTSVSAMISPAGPTTRSRMLWPDVRVLAAGSSGAFAAAARLTCWLTCPSCTVQLIEQGGARRARSLRQGQQRGLPAWRARVVVVCGAGKHHAVDHQRVLARREQFRQPYPGRRAVGPWRLEDVVLWHYPTRRQPPPGLSHRLHRTAQLDLLFNQQVPRDPVLGGLPRKRDGHGSSPDLAGFPCVRPAGPTARRTPRPAITPSVRWPRLAAGCGGQVGCNMPGKRLMAESVARRRADDHDERNGQGTRGRAGRRVGAKPPLADAEPPDLHGRRPARA
jgi:hypothetical protein